MTYLMLTIVLSAGVLTYIIGTATANYQDRRREKLKQELLNTIL